MATVPTESLFAVAQEVPKTQIGSTFLAARFHTLPTVQVTLKLASVHELELEPELEHKREFVTVNIMNLLSRFGPRVRMGDILKLKSLFLLPARAREGHLILSSVSLGSVYTSFGLLPCIWSFV